MAEKQHFTQQHEADSPCECVWPACTCSLLLRCPDAPGGGTLLWIIVGTLCAVLVALAWWGGTYVEVP